MNPDCERIVDVLDRWLNSRLDAASMAWVRDRQKVIRSGDKRGLYLAFGMVPRKAGKVDLALTDVELSAADQTRPGWSAKGWTVDQAVRTLFVLSFPSGDAALFVATLDQLFGTGEVGELVALYQALPLLPHPSAHVLRAAEGIRTNIQAVFRAVAHQNPYPSEQFTEDQWNQMVLKCQFIGVPMSRVVGLDQRANARLALMVTDFIHERRAARRPVPPELWRCVGRFADARALADLQDLLTSGSSVDQRAAALALSECPTAEARQILSTAPDLARSILKDQLDDASTISLTRVCFSTGVRPIRNHPDFRIDSMPVRDCDVLRNDHWS